MKNQPKLIDKAERIMKKIVYLVTSVTRFLGSNACSQLLESGEKVMIQM